MKKFLIAASACLMLIACNNEKKEDKKNNDNSATATTGDPKKPATELLELSEGAAIKKSFDAFAKGDIDGMVADFDDNIRYTWSGGDSLIGKQAVKDYYTGRWKMIQSLSFSNHIVLPLQVNESQQPEVAPPGKWVLYWQMADVTYKNGKNLKFWTHSVNHLTDAGKIDFTGIYIDRHPIMEATKDMAK